LSRCELSHTVPPPSLIPTALDSYVVAVLQFSLCKGALLYHRSSTGWAKRYIAACWSVLTADQSEPSGAKCLATLNNTAPPLQHHYISCVGICIPHSFQLL